MFNPFSALTSKIFAGVAIFALTLAAIQTIRLEGFFFFDGVIEKLEKERAAHITTKVGYANAQLVAAELNRHQVAAIKRRYDAIAEKSEIEYEKRLASNKLALNDWMRRQALGRPTESTGAGSATQVQSEAAGTEAVPVIPRGFVIVPESDLDKTADIQATLAALQEAARAIEQSGNTTSSGRD